MRNGKIIVFVFILALTCHLRIFSQKYNLKYFPTNSGLASSSINYIHQDKYGHIWFATQGAGVSRYDGRKFNNYNRTNGLAGNEALAFCDDNDGNLWIATTDGVSKFDGQNFMNFDTTNGLTHNYVYSIYKDRKGVLWFATFGGGFVMYDGITFTSLGKKEGMPTDSVFCITEDKQGNYWMGTYKHGLVKYDGKSFQSFSKPEGLTHNSVFSLLLDSHNTLWIGTTSGGITLYDFKTFKPHSYNDAIKNDLIGKIIEDKHGDIWATTDQNGILRTSKNNSFQFISEKEGLPSNNAYGICEDYQGYMWFGTLAGPCQLKHEGFMFYDIDDGLFNKKIVSVSTNDDGYCYAGTTSGLNIIAPDGLILKETLQELKNSAVYAILFDSQKRLWIGTWENGIYVYEKRGDKWILSKSYTTINGQKFLNVSRLIEDNTGNIWAATYGYGVIVFKTNGQIEKHDNTGSLSSNSIYSLFKDNKGNIWIGSYLGGVTKYDGKTFTNYTSRDSLPDNSVTNICQDKQGRIIMATAEKGICYFDGKKFKSITIEQGINSNNIQVLLVDNDSNIWLGTERGLDKIRLDEDSFKIKRITHYTSHEGFKGDEVYQGAISQDKNGFIWIGTIEGLLRYNPAKDQVSNVPPKLKLSGIRLFYEEIDWADILEDDTKFDQVSGLPVSLTLSYQSNNLTFEFQALTTDNVSYSYKLEGLDNDWSPLKSDNEAVYPFIGPGTYIFRVKAVNSNGIKSENEIAYTITITPPFYKTWWFLMLMGLAGIFLVIFFIRYRTQRLEREKKKLEEKVEERTIELKHAHNRLSLAFTDIQDSINYAKKIQEAILPLHNDITRALPECFVLYKPRNVVSGDFYWFNQKDDLIFIAAVDCTGHGVPGAFMSMIGNSLLNEIVNDKKIIQPAQILTQLNQGVRGALKQDRDDVESKDGMDLAFCMIDKKKSTLSFTGAKRPIWILRNQDDGYAHEEIKGDKFSIGGMQMDARFTFTNHQVQLNKGDIVYIFSDGYADQFGGDNGKKLTTKRFRENLLSIATLPIHQQKKWLEDSINSWKGEMEQVDDILVIGIKF